MTTKVQQAHSLGKRGEILVKDYLIREGFVIVASNIRIRGGEIDLIAKKKNIIVCVEVKTRTKSDVDLAELISPWQQKRIITTARYFIAKQKLDDITCRFDVALIIVDSLSEPQMMYIEDAFQEEL